MGGPYQDMSTVTGMVAAIAAEAADAAAIRCDGAAGRRVVTYAELDRLGWRTAGGLAALGVGPGDRVAFWLPNVAAWIALYLGCAHLGAIAVAVNTRFRSAEVGDIIARTGAKALAVWPGFRGLNFMRILADIDAAALANLETVIVYADDDEGDALPALPAALEGRRIVRYGTVAEWPAIEKSCAAPEAGCNIFTTSGTTSAPKFVLHCQRAIVSHARDVARDFAMDTPDAAALQALPLCGVFGFSQAMATLAAGAPMTLLPLFDAERAAMLVRDERITHMNATDGMYQAMLNARPEPKPFPTLRLAGFAAFGTESGDIVGEAETRGLQLTGLYGMSEIQALFARQKPEAPPEVRGHAGGWPVSASAEFRIRDPETGRLLPHGQSGELEVRGPSRMVGYFGDDAATAKALTADGFVRTGDLCHSLADGSFVFHARMGDALRLGGFLVNPAEIEDFVLRRPGISGCQVVGVDLGGETRPFAFVTLSEPEGFDGAALTRYCARGMARYKTPVAFHVLEQFPTTQSPNGTKIQRARLRAMATELIRSHRSPSVRSGKDKGI